MFRTRGRTGFRPTPVLLFLIRYKVSRRKSPQETREGKIGKEVTDLVPVVVERGTLLVA